MHKPRVNSPLPNLLVCQNAGVVPLCLCTHTSLCDPLATAAAAAAALACQDYVTAEVGHGTCVPCPADIYPRILCSQNFTAATKNDRFQSAQSAG